MLRRETIGCVVLDTGCNINVCGLNWLEEYLEMIDETDRRSVVEQNSNKYFRFGDGKSVKARKRVKLPGYLGKERVIIETEVIESDIPLLFSKSFMKKLGMVIDLEEDRVYWKKGEIKDLKVTSTGHYAVAVSKCQNFEDEKNFIRYVLYSYGIKDAKAKALKLHRQFAHPSKEKLISLIREAGIGHSELEEEIRKIEGNCETCIKFKRAPSRPVVSIPMARDFNEIVSMDLKFWQDKYFLVMVDLATRFCNACVIKSKSANVIIDGVMRYWIALFGSPRKILTDNGGEFNNSEFRSMAENFNIKVMCTAAESPWSNGVCERLNAVLKDNVLKILEENECSVETALAWAVSARNTLHNNNGFSPNQLVFSFNPSLPNIIEDRMPALENVTSSKVVANNLNALRKSKEEFMKADANERIRRALSRNVSKTSESDIEIGNYVYYKRESEDRWRGPARVIGKDGKVNILRHGGQIVRAHICRIQEVSKVPSTEEHDEESSEIRQATRDSNNRGVEDDSSDDEFAESVETDINAERAGETEQESSQLIPRVGKRYEVTLTDSNAKMNVVILSRAGKATGKYKECYNFRDESSGRESWMDFKKDVCEIREMGEDEEVMITMYDERTMEAKSVTTVY